jgi:predicted RNase H-like nuclease (RuvC/YqgF family)
MKKNKSEGMLAEYEDTIRELKKANRRLKSDNQRLKSEIDTLHQAFEKTSAYIKNNTDNISVEKIISGVKSNKNLEQIKKTNKCEKCGSLEVQSFYVPNVGRVVFCGSCKDRKVVKDEKEKE